MKTFFCLLIVIHPLFVKASHLRKLAEGMTNRTKQSTNDDYQDLFLVDETVKTEIKNGFPVGYLCKYDWECYSGYCSPEKKTCYASPECKAIKQPRFSSFHENRIILVFVGSGFTSLADWRTQVATTYSTFADYEFFESSNEQFHAFYVDKLEPSFCYYNCAGIQRLLCCDIQKSYELTNSCFPPGSVVQTVVVHNGEAYGGAGYTTDNVATTSRNLHGPKVAVHELGHSLFDLADEYTGGWGTAAMPNCDNYGCAKWADLNAHLGGGLCNYGFCQSGGYYAADTASFMNILNYNVDPVNLRYSCCTYLVFTGDTPDYCDQFEAVGEGLATFCAKDYQNYGWPFGSGTSSLSMKGKYARVQNPIVLSLDVRGLQTSSYTTFTKPQTRKIILGVYKKSKFLGDFANVPSASARGQNQLLEVQIWFRAGVRKTLLFSALQDVEVPLPDSTIPLADHTEPYATVPRSNIEVLLDESEGPILKVDVQMIGQEGRT